MSPQEPAGGGRQFDLVDLDDATVDRILDEPDPWGAPPGYVNATSVLAAASRPPTADELAAEALVLAAYRQALVGPSWRSRGRRILARVGRPRVAAAVIVAGLTIDGGLAATATGDLPAPAQRIASDLLGLVGIKVPDPHGGPQRRTPGPAVSPTTDQGGSGPAPVGSSANPSPSSTALGASRHETNAVVAPTTTSTGPLSRSTTSASSAAGSGPANGNAWGHINNTAGPPGQAANNGNGNAWGHINNTAGPPGQAANNGNGNAWGHTNNTVGPPGQAANNGNGNGNAWGHTNKTSGPSGPSAINSAGTHGQKVGHGHG